MKTDELIALLAADTMPVPRHVTVRRLAGGVAAGTVISLLAMVAWLGFNPVLADYLLLPMFWVKFGMPMVMAMAGLVLVARLGRPGDSSRGAWMAWAAPIGLMWLLGAVALSQAPAADAAFLMLSWSWRICAATIVALALPVFVGAIWALRGVAPVRLRLAGAGAGALAGAVGAAVYALHCMELAAPFIAIGYVLGMVLPLAVGALAGPRLLRW
ncbi:DUF1109 domain-containing protein [Xylophilus sp. GOD-11R]|uniref:DUF1109 domain-containing protein n=1 Tax=Xylophilus sp. GOD-11R TaxID=3089814 RepID=UPI00298D367B|nr:DUF1109 domain-containing protein [Xylophilus sp. GOD-11R]WPB54962.1 DUF1109 domain-containing protein [Xylophilus sp. GOD-11R]